MTAQIDKREAERAKIRNVIAALEALHRKPDDADYQLWVAEEYAAMIGTDDLDNYLEVLRLEASDCDECERAHCICEGRLTGSMTARFGSHPTVAA